MLYQFHELNRSLLSPLVQSRIAESGVRLVSYSDLT